jgi:hypothetical protein|tara:strand:- start:311 stop:535 length:225 start_codon:yes stop_codon:yes gene_type:complete
MAKKKEDTFKLVHEDKEMEFNLSDLSEEARLNYTRANEIATQTVRLEQQLVEMRFLINNYVKFVANELDDNKKK